MAMMRSQKMHPPATQAHWREHLKIHQIKFEEELVKKRLKNKSTITVDQQTNGNSTKPISNQCYQRR